jgi:UDP-glucose 4-epimerase
MSAILTTGGLGFIGSHTCITLISNGFDVIIVDSLVNSSKETLENIKKIVNSINELNDRKIYFYHNDLKDKKEIDKIFQTQISLRKPIDAVIHFAGLKSVQDSVMNPLKYWDENISATLSLLSVMAKYDCKKLVFSSSATIYKPIQDSKLNEDSYQEPINPYGNTKITIEKILNDLFLSDKSWKIINLRYFNPVGAHPSGFIGEDPKIKASNLFPIITKVLLGDLEKLYIFGNDWPTPDGTCIRDYIHVMDLAEAHIAALKFVKVNKPQKISINIGTGKGHSVLDVIKTYSRVNCIELPYEFSERREGDAPFVIADNSLALKLLQWEPKKNMDDMCKDSFRFINSYNGMGG